jgi:hypothetical protein
LSSHGGADARPERVVVLHVDDHDDLMSPRIVRDGGRWIDAITRCPFELSDQDSIRAAIHSGAVGIGSFIVPLLFHLPRVDIRHLYSPRPRTGLAGAFRLGPESTTDDLLAPGKLRQAVRLDDADEGPPTPDTPAGTYIGTADRSQWLDDLPDAPVLLHIDLDYFNNRYDSSPDWRERVDRHDPGEAEILDSVDALFDALVATGASEKVVDIAVAISPRFFPAEYWCSTVERVRNKIDECIPIRGR